MTEQGSAAAPALPKPLAIACTTADCEKELHCFRATKKMRAANQIGQCRYCGANLVDWERVQLRDSHDIAHTLEAMRLEFIRHHFWHVAIDQKAANYARRKGKIGLKEAVKNRIERSVGASEPVRDGRQTPMAGNPVYYAQHATASCCRTCIEEWHAIPKGRPLSQDEIQYLSELAMRYLTDRLPNLTDEGEKVPPIRKPPTNKTLDAKT